MSVAFPSAAPAAARARALRLDSPAGPLILRESQGAITGLQWLKPNRSVPQAEPSAGWDSGGASPLLLEAARQIGEYFAGRRRGFDLALAPAGSPFHQNVWQLMRGIPFGGTATYGELARELGCAAQPVGGACAANPIAILIPCHRVVAATGLGGFSGGAGVESKRFLLRHEGALQAELDLF